MGTINITYTNTSGKDILKCIGNLILEIRELNDRARMYREKAVIISRSIGHNGYNRSQTEEALYKRLIINAENLETKAQELAESLENLIDQVLQALTIMEDLTQTDILMKRYIELKSWDSIINEIGYSKGYVFKLHRKALENFGSVIDKSNVLESHKSARGGL